MILRQGSRYSDSVYSQHQVFLFAVMLAFRNNNLKE